MGAVRATHAGRELLREIDSRFLVGWSNDVSCRCLPIFAGEGRGETGLLPLGLDIFGVQVPIALA